MPKGDRLTQKQESFCLDVFGGMSQRAAYQKNYTCGTMSLAVIDVKASELVSHGKVSVRLTELRSKAESASVATVLERKQRLTELVRANVSDYLDIEGRPVLDKQTRNQGAIAGFEHVTTFTKQGEMVITKSIKFRDMVQAISELNKMEGVGKGDTPVGDNHTHVTVFNVINPQTQNLLERLDNGQREPIEIGSPTMEPDGSIPQKP